MTRGRERRYRIEHGLLCGFDRLINGLPLQFSRGLGRLVAVAGHAVCRRRIREGRRRVREVFGDRYTRLEEARLIRHAWRNLALCGVDMLRAARFTNDWLEEHTNIEEVRRRLAPTSGQGRGAVIACAHMGSWEVAAVAGRRFGLPIFAIAAPQKNPYFNQWMIGLRERAGVDTLLRGDPNLIRKVVRRLKAGQYLAILPDIRVPSAGVPVPFLGRSANIGPGMALFARMAGVPIIPCLTYRLDNGDHRFVIEPAIEPDLASARDADIERMTLEVMQRIERAIRERPDQWFWFNKRWILDPVDDPVEH